jgi:hypothetical protein
MQFCTSGGQVKFDFAELCGGFCELRRNARNPRALGREIESDGFSSGNHGFEDFFQNRDFARVCVARVKGILNGFEHAFDIWSGDDTRELREIEPLQGNGFETNERCRHQNFFRVGEVDLDEVVAFSICTIQDALEIGGGEVEVLPVERLGDARSSVDGGS